jgi:putative ABC transport system permease protein
MTWRITFREALAALRFHRARTLFTTLSLAWGVACFVILMSYGDGFKAALNKAWRAVGQDLVLTFGGQTSSQAGGLRAGRRIRLEYANASLIKESVPYVGALSPEIMKPGVKASHLGRDKEVTLRGVWPEYEQVRNIRLIEGRWINEDDQSKQNRVAVLGSKAAKELFAGAPAPDQDITLNGMRFTVIGVLDFKLQIANYNRPDNECIFIPYNSFNVFGDTRYPRLLVWTPQSADVRDRAIHMVRAKLAEIHRFSPNDQKAVEILAFSKFMKIVDGMSLAVQALLGFVGALTLAIGGVGLANIMLASVIDRTREIGMIKALGGRRRWILRQFLAEASMVVAFGGLLGVAIGVAATRLIGSMPFLGPAFEDTSGVGDIYLHVSPMAVAVSMAVLFLVGLAAGLVPAMKASRLDPIEALHYE